ncbi:hypothetical protein T01_5422 [Trichinella spiralis]|uniref:Uncharacterized protein n=1 Tax=Trichinella spiralis TaxID=6334 RepID=A0A0V0YT26_TRISP|nr:hypothetical protein T01_5422 [Trichinella spiralis]
MFFGNWATSCGSAVRKPDTVVSRSLPIALSSNRWPFSLSCRASRPSLPLATSFGTLKILRICASNTSDTR